MMQPHSHWAFLWQIRHVTSSLLPLKQQQKALVVKAEMLLPLHHLMGSLQPLKLLEFALFPESHWKGPPFSFDGDEWPHETVCGNTWPRCEIKPHSCHCHMALPRQVLITRTIKKKRDSFISDEDWLNYLHWEEGEWYLTPLSISVHSSFLVFPHRAAQAGHRGIPAGFLNFSWSSCEMVNRSWIQNYTCMWEGL